MDQDRSSSDPGGGESSLPLHPGRLPDGQWMFDWFSPHEFTAHAFSRILFRKRSPFQEIEILETRDHGRCLVLNSETQSYEKDEYIYHETLVHPAMALHPDPRRVLVVGGGEGATLREVLKHRTVTEGVMVELDSLVVEAARLHLDTFHAGAFEDPRTRLEIGDGRAYLEEGKEAFDVIFLDINNPLEGSPSQRLFTREFYTAASRRLAPGGLLVVQAGAATPLNLTCPVTIYQTLKSVLGRCFPVLSFVPSFASEWTFVVGGEGLGEPLDLPAEVVDQRLALRLTSPLRFYDGHMHQRMFRLPRYLREALGRPHPLSQDGQLLSEQFPGCSLPG